MKVNLIKKSKLLVIVGVVAVAALATGVGLVHKASVHAASTNAASADGETNDDAKGKTVQTGNVQDNGQDGETVDNASQ